ncbi:MAG TPA: F0F1 ATP synthase subunit gamma [Rickettsiales bacterium]|nr:F0F1 ATP synthase subunit gamma [Rickettsiales bacterium]
MPSLKDLKNRIKSVKSTQKITKAMKMVSAAKLRRAKERAEAARPYAEKMAAVVASVAASQSAKSSNNPLMSGTGKLDTHLIVVMTSDRGLCGAFNSSITRATKKKVAELRRAGKEVKLFCVGKKAYELLKADFGHVIVGRLTDIGRKQIGYTDAEHVARAVMKQFETGTIDAVHIVFNHFKSAISQVVTFQQIIPLEAPENSETAGNLLYEFEPEEDAILPDLLPRNITVQIYSALLENAASEQGARMTAMDNATRNAGEMIGKLTLRYNRTRQATITKELIEIISGAEAL